MIYGTSSSSTHATTRASVTRPSAASCITRPPSCAAGWISLPGPSRAATCGSRLFTLLDMELSIKDAPGARDLVVTEGTLKFDNVDFRYPGANDNLVFSGVSFTARRGETIGILGRGRVTN